MFESKVIATSSDATRDEGGAREKGCFFHIPISDPTNTSYWINLAASLLEKQTPSSGITEQI